LRWAFGEWEWASEFSEVVVFAKNVKYLTFIRLKVYTQTSYNEVDTGFKNSSVCGVV